VSGSRDAKPPRSPLPRALRPVTVPASRIYGMIVAARNRRFDRGQGVQRIDRPVISIGNLTTGGTGKTPIVTWFAREMLAAGHHPAIAMRGYNARPGQLSDEQAEYGELLPDVPVVANPDRVTALREFLPQHPEVDCVLLDDGFQHRQLHRDLDLVLIDAEAGTLRDELLPAGNLREEVGELRRADGVIVTHAKEVDAELAREIERWHGRPPIAWAKHRWKGLHSPLPSGERPGGGGGAVARRATP
jgi:tetraacyldisaccharide 4'-kinase